MNLADTIRSIPDFPKKGILFRDITTLLQDPRALHQTLDELEAHYRDSGVDCIAGIESRGFIFGAALADRMGTGFVTIRKPGKLPAETISAEYALEYGTDRIEMHADALQKGSRVLLVDDLLATGGTAAAACTLVEKAGGAVASCCFVVELAGLKGRDLLSGHDVFSLITF